MPDAPARPVDKLSFEEAMAELEGIVDKLEHGNVPLEQSIAFYERGEALKDRCDTLLRSAEMRVEKVRLKAGQPVGTEPLDPEPEVRTEPPVRAAPARPGPARPDPATLDSDDDIPF